jgi:hypothetical protein
MAEFELDVARFFQSSEWLGAMQSVESKMSACISSCKDSDTSCQASCQVPYKCLQKSIQYKKDLYIRRGISFCKHQCWDSKEITPCVSACVKDYSALLKDFEEAVLKKVSAVNFP